MKFTFTLLVLSTLLLASCKRERQLQSGLYLDNIDSTHRAVDNFDGYVNGRWLATHEIPADKSSYGAFELVREKAEKDVYNLIQEAIHTRNQSQEDEQISNLFLSYMNVNQRNQDAAKQLNRFFTSIDKINDLKQLASYLALSTQMGIESPIQFYVTTDDKSPDDYIVATRQSGTILRDRTYYLINDSVSVQLRKKYLQHITNMFTIAGIDTSLHSPKQVLAIETSIAQLQMKKEDARNRDLTYNKFNQSELLKLMPHFPLNTYLTKTKFIQQKQFIVGQVDFLKSMDQLFTTTSISNWKTYLKWLTLSSLSPLLSKKLEAENINFKQKTLLGILDQPADWKIGVQVVNANLGEVVGKKYVQKHFAPEAKIAMETLTQNLLKAYEINIKELSWMSKKTKKAALQKLKQINVKIGYPTIWKDYSQLRLNKTHYAENIFTCRQFEYNYKLAKLGTKVNRKEWFTPPQTVNAYYSQTKNEIVFPAGILQPPFYNYNAENAVNYGGIGAVIGHEIGHAFDDQGSRFDGKGTLRDWWTKADKKAFVALTEKLIHQYDAFEVCEDLHVNGTYTLGENIGDLGGLSIALKAYKMSLGKEKPTTMDGFTAEQRVFMGWGQIWLNKYREEAIRNLIATDTHAPSKFRINGIVRNIHAFYTSFQVKPKDSLYLAPKQRVKIW